SPGQSPTGGVGGGDTTGNLASPPPVVVIQPPPSQASTETAVAQPPFAETPVGGTIAPPERSVVGGPVPEQPPMAAPNDSDPLVLGATTQTTPEGGSGAETIEISAVDMEKLPVEPYDELAAASATAAPDDTLPLASGLPPSQRPDPAELSALLMTEVA